MVLTTFQSLQIGLISLPKIYNMGQQSPGVKTRSMMKSSHHQEVISPVLTDRPVSTPLAFSNINYVLPMTLMNRSDLVNVEPLGTGSFVMGNQFRL